MIFKAGQVVEKVKGADPRKLQDVVKKLAAEAEGGPSSSGFGGVTGGDSTWRIGHLPRGYNDVTDQVDVKGLELLNADSEFGTVRVLIYTGKPTGLQKGKVAASAGKDWVESDTDEQLMLFMPFQSTLKVHTLQVSLHPPLAVTRYIDLATDYLSPAHLRRRRTTHETEDHPNLHQPSTHPRFRRGRRYPSHTKHNSRKQGLG